MKKLAGRLSFLASSVVVFGLASLLGCKGVISSGGDGGGGGGGGGAGGGSSTTTTGVGGAGGETGCDPIACSYPAVAMSYLQFMDAMGQQAGDPVPDMQYLQYGAGVQTPTCSAPFGSYDGCGGWTASITLPTAWLTPGTYPFAANEIDLYYTASFADGPNACSGEASAGFQEGELVILEVTDSLVRFRVQGIQNADVPIVGDFEADRCPLLD